MRGEQPKEKPKGYGRKLVEAVRRARQYASGRLPPAARDQHEPEASYQFPPNAERLTLRRRLSRRVSLPLWGVWIGGALIVCSAWMTMWTVGRWSAFEFALCQLGEVRGVAETIEGLHQELDSAVHQFRDGVSVWRDVVAEVEEVRDRLISEADGLASDLATVEDALRTPRSIARHPRCPSRVY